MLLSLVSSGSEFYGLNFIISLYLIISSASTMGPWCMARAPRWWILSKDTRKMEGEELSTSLFLPPPEAAADHRGFSGPVPTWKLVGRWQATPIPGSKGKHQAGRRRGVSPMAVPGQGSGPSSLRALLQRRPSLRLPVQSARKGGQC